MPGLVPGIHVFRHHRQARRGWPEWIRPWQWDGPRVHCPQIPL